MNNFKEKVNKDSWAFGAFLAVSAPIIAFFIFHYLFQLLMSLLKMQPLETERLYLLSMSVNLLLMRYYLVAAKKMKTGKSILVLTFLMIILFFLFLY